MASSVSSRPERGEPLQIWEVVKQYQNATNLSARIQLHSRFSTNRYGWLRWVFDQFDLSPQSHILELGCGNGMLWVENRDRISAGWDITLSDFSSGMLADAQRNLAAVTHPFHFTVINAHDIPYPDATFDAVIANHMLYYVDDKLTAFAAIKRVLKPGGRFYATTVGQRHMAESKALIHQYDPTHAARFSDDGLSFLLENGLAQLQPWFPDVTLRRYADGLVVTEIEPLVDYIMSAETLRVADRTAFTRFVENTMVAQNGVIHIQKDSGIFIGQRETV